MPFRAMLPVQLFMSLLQPLRAFHLRASGRLVAWAGSPGSVWWLSSLQVRISFSGFMFVQSLTHLTLQFLSWPSPWVYKVDLPLPLRKGYGYLIIRSWQTLRSPKPSRLCPRSSLPTPEHQRSLPSYPRCGSLNTLLDRWLSAKVQWQLSTCLSVVWFITFAAHMSHLLPLALPVPPWRRSAMALPFQDSWSPRCSLFMWVISLWNFLAEVLIQRISTNIPIVARKIHLCSRPAWIEASHL